MKKKLDLDKKSDKFLQGYILADQNENKTEFEPDHTSHQSDRLIIHPQSLQYVIEGDSWFGDQLVMERTFYKPK